MHQLSTEEEVTRSFDLEQDDLNSLRKWLNTRKHLPNVSDDMLILFHHSCYFDKAMTQHCIETYYTLRTNTPEFFTNRDLSYPALAKASQASNFATLPRCDPTGSQIIFHSLRQRMDPSSYSQEEGIKLMIMTIDACLLSHGPTDGLVILIDMQGFKLAHFMRISLSAIRKFVKYLQEGNPTRLKAMHFINVVSFIDTIMTVVKPLVKDELRSLLHFHSNLTTLFEHIPKECLPSDYGGELASVEQLNAQHNIRLQSLAGYFAAEENMRVDEKKREKRKKNKNKEP